MPKKKITYRLMCAEDGEKEFYSVMGKFFASMDIRREVGYAISNDDNRLWVVAFEGEHVIGFASFGIDKKGCGHFYDAWIAEKHRHKGIYKIMTNYRMHWFVNHNISAIRIIVPPEGLEFYKKLGFTVETMRGKYSWMVGKPVFIEGSNNG